MNNVTVFKLYRCVLSLKDFKIEYDEDWESYRYSTPRQYNIIKFNNETIQGISTKNMEHAFELAYNYVVDLRNSLIKARLVMDQELLVSIEKGSDG